jgi:Uma2 family endonuclease
MSTETTIPKNEAAIESIDPPEWQPPDPPTNLVFDDGVPLETNRHRIAMNVLIDSALTALQNEPNSFVGGNMFVYYSRTQAMNRDFRGPDFFAVLDVPADRVRQGWVVWEEEGRYPDLIIELLSDSTAKVDLGAKKQLYERTFRTGEYYVYDPFDPTALQGWRLEAARYQPIAPDDRGWLWCETLGLWLGTWEGCIRREPAIGNCTWLRFYDQAGTLIPLPPEVAEQEHQRAEQERQRAEQESQRAEQESQRAEQESQRAEQESQRAEQERQRAEQESQRAEQESQRAERLAARLRQLGEDPEEF